MYMCLFKSIINKKKYHESEKMLGYIWYMQKVLIYQENETFCVLLTFVWRGIVESIALQGM